MKRKALILANGLMLLLSVATLAASGWLWQRSVTVADFYHRVEPDGKGRALRGVGSYRGAVLIGSIRDALTAPRVATYQHERMSLVATATSGGKPLMEAEANYKAGGLGFGVSRGELKLNVPFAFLLPTRVYQVVYVPYYFIMLMAAVPLVRAGWRLRGRTASAAV